MEKKVIEIVQGVTRHPLYRTKTPVDLCIRKGEQIAIVGENGSGKTRLVDIITGKLPLLRNEVAYDFSPSPYPLISDNIKSITFRDSYGDHDGTYYYQQRWNQHDIDESVPTVGTLLEECFRNNCRQEEAGNRRKEELRDKLYQLFHLEELEDKRIITLSSGELRKFQLTKTLLAAPKVLIMDNPYIGLDSTAREQLTDLLKKLIAETDLQVILVLSRNSDIPDFITHVIPVKDLEVLPKTERNAFLEQNPESAHFDASAIELMLSELQKNERPEENLGGDILKFNNIHIQYGKRVILDQLNWQVKKGEKWALKGQNGSGKSTLLSLVCADNPQSYACDIELFGKKRGTGESIWDIKKQIGYVSPEMHRAYLKDMPALDIVASGLNDSVGLYVRPKPEQKEICVKWMELFGIAHLKDSTFLKISSGEQRLCLLARAFVKNPPLLILDEPLHGLDHSNRERVKFIIEKFAEKPGKTLIMVTHYAEDLPPVIDHELVLCKQGDCNTKTTRK